MNLLVTAPFLIMDVNHDDGTIDWPTVAKNNVAGAYLKASEGLTFTDPQFATNRAGTAAAGITSGAYHFYHFADDPTAQAKFFCSIIGEIQDYEIACCVDVEEGSFVQQGDDYVLPPGKTAAQCVADLITFGNYVCQKLDTGVVIYTNRDTWVNLLGNPTNFANNDLWVAEYGVSEPTLFGGWQDWAFWQYSESGTVAGNPNTGNTDLNHYNWASGIL